MKQATLRWAFYMAAVLVLGPLAGALTGAVRAGDGGVAATPLASGSPAAGVLAGLGAFLIAAVAGLAAGRVAMVRAGMLTAGLVLAWAAWRTGTVEGVLRSSMAAGTLWRLGVEAALFGALGVGLIVALCVFGRPDEHHPDRDSPAEGGVGGAVRSMVTPDALIGAAVSAAVAGFVAWFVAASMLKGQAVFAGILAALLGVAAGRVVRYQAPAGALAAGVAAVAVIGPVLGAVLHGGGLAAAVNAGMLVPLARPLPLDWVAGMLIGTPLGLTWAGSMMEKHVSDGAGVTRAGGALGKS